MSGAAFVRNFSKKVISINMIDWETGRVNVHSWESCCRGGSSSSQWGPNGTLNSVSPNTGRGPCANFRAIRTFITQSRHLLHIWSRSKSCQLPLPSVYRLQSVAAPSPLPSLSHLNYLKCVSPLLKILHWLRIRLRVKTSALPVALQALMISPFSPTVTLLPPTFPLSHSTWATWLPYCYRNMPGHSHMEPGQWLLLPCLGCCPIRKPLGSSSNLFQEFP